MPARPRRADRPVDLSADPSFPPGDRESRTINLAGALRAPRFLRSALTRLRPLTTLMTLIATGACLPDTSKAVSNDALVGTGLAQLSCVGSESVSLPADFECDAFSQPRNRLV